MHSGIFVKMMTAARFRYKKRTPAPQQTTPKRTLRSNQSGSKTNLNSSQASLNCPATGNSLTVPCHPIRKRSGSVPALKIQTLATLWNLKYEHVRAVKTTWSRLCEPPRSNCKGIVNLVERVWEKLDNKDPSVRALFYNAAFVDSMKESSQRRHSKGSIATIRDHTHFFVSLVSQVVQNLENEPESILEHIDKIGRNHAYLKKYGFKSSHWEKVGEYFVDIVVIQDCVRGFPDGCRAWTFLIAAIVDRLRSAPRRVSLACSFAGSNQSLAGSTLSMTALRRGSLASSVANGSQSSLGSGGCPAMRIPGHHASTSELYDRDENFARDQIAQCARHAIAGSCIDLGPLAAELPKVDKPKTTATVY